MNLSWLFGRNEEVIPEKLWALRNKLPVSLNVAIEPSKDGGYVATVANLPGCFTEGNTFAELNDMINAAVYDYFDVPQQYVPHLISYSPSPEVIADMERRGEKFVTQGKLLFQRA